MLGDAPNDAPSGDDAAAVATQADTPETPNYNINQFVEPGQTQGLPGAWIGTNTTAPGGGGSAPAPAPRPAPRAAASPPSSGQ
jgi:hypothetical protein